MLKAILFDIDGVLLNSFEANLKFYQDLMVKAGYPPLKREAAPALFHLTMRNAIKKITGSTSEAEIEKIWKMGRDRAVPYPMELLSMYDGVEETIKILSKNYQLAIVTSRVRNGIYTIPQLKKLEKYFKATVSCEDTAEPKPSGEPLFLAAHKLGLKPEECVYVGDTETDIMAARAARTKIIIYSKIKFNQADASISDFRKLPEAIAELRQ